jgi:hypothetical protein
MGNCPFLLGIPLRRSAWVPEALQKKPLGELRLQSALFMKVRSEEAQTGMDTPLC